MNTNHGRFAATMSTLFCLILAFVGCDGPPSPGPDGGTADMQRIIRPDKQYTLGTMQVPPGNDVSLCYFAKTTEQQTVYAQGIRVRGTSAMLHHAIVYVVPPGNYQNHACPHGGYFGWKAIHATFGIDESYLYAADTGVEIPPGWLIVVQAHAMNDSSKPQDLGIEVTLQYTQGNPPKLGGLYVLQNEVFQLPPGVQKEASVSGSFMAIDPMTFQQSPIEIELLDAQGHTHNYGISSHLELVDEQGVTQFTETWPGGSAPISAFPQPIKTNGKMTYRLSCVWKNTSGFAIGFPDEMCVAAGHFSIPVTDKAKYGGSLLCGMVGDLPLSLCFFQDAVISPPGDNVVTIRVARSASIQGIDSAILNAKRPVYAVLYRPDQVDVNGFPAGPQFTPFYNAAYEALGNANETVDIPFYNVPDGTYVVNAFIDTGFKGSPLSSGYAVATPTTMMAKGGESKTVTIIVDKKY